MSRPETTPYSSRWYQTQRDSALESARVVVPIVQELAPARRIVDVGCGTGAWLRAFLDRGVLEEDVLGLDGDYVDRSLLMIPAARFRATDLARPIELNDRFDLVISLEVAEHLPASSAATFVETLTRLGPVVLFSAAFPNQGGMAHVNERWPAYWARLFRERGFVPVDALRKRIWYAENVEYWYQQNTFFYVQRDQLSRFPKLEHDALKDGEQPVAMFHPRLFLHHQDLARTSLKRFTHRILRRLKLLPNDAPPPFDGDI